MKQKIRVSSRFKKQQAAGDERSALLQSLQETKRELDLARLGFNQCTDSDLIEFYLFEMDALRARHTYLLRRIKALDSPPHMTPPAHLAQEPRQAAQ